MRRTKICLRVLALICAVCSCDWAQDPGWPRKLVKPAGTVLVYQPQVDDWQNFTDIKWRAAFQLRPNGGSSGSSWGGSHNMGGYGGGGRSWAVEVVATAEGEGNSDWIAWPQF